MCVLRHVPEQLRSLSGFLDASYDALDSLEHRGAFLPAVGRPA